MSKKIVSRGTAILRNTIKLYDVPNIPHQPVYHDMHANILAFTMFGMIYLT